jgi:protein gp37
MKMADKSKIEWLDGGSTWNPAYGCSKVSAGCKNCYAHRMISTRFPHLTGCWNGPHRFEEIPKGWDGDAHFKPERLEIPFHWKKPRRIFVCSMSDLFHESLTDEQIAAVFGVMAACPRHTFIVLTKRLNRALEWFDAIAQKYLPWINMFARVISISEPIINIRSYFQPGYMGKRRGETPIEWPLWPLSNVIMCASVENQKTADEREPLLLRVPARWRGLSVEPMLEGIDIRKYIGCDCEEFWPGQGHPPDCPTQTGQMFNLVICGAETGPGKRPFKDEWALDLRDQCKSAGTPFFFKKDGAGKPTLCGVKYHEWVK